MRKNIKPLCSYLVVVSDLSENSAEVLDSEVDITVHLFVHPVVRRIWVSVGWGEGEILKLVHRKQILQLQHAKEHKQVCKYITIQPIPTHTA